MNTDDDGPAFGVKAGDGEPILHFDSIEEARAYFADDSNFAGYLDDDLEEARQALQISHPEGKRIASSKTSATESRQFRTKLYSR